MMSSLRQRPTSNSKDLETISPRLAWPRGAPGAPHDQAVTRSAQEEERPRRVSRVPDLRWTPGRSRLSSISICSHRRRLLQRMHVPASGEL